MDSSDLASSRAERATVRVPTAGTELGSDPVQDPASTATEPWLLDSRDVSRLLGIGRTKVFQMMARAEIPVVRIGRSVRVPRGALEHWIESSTRCLPPASEVERLRHRGRAWGKG